MLVTINAYIKYVYYLLAIVLLIVLIMLLIKLAKVSKTFKTDLVGINNINDKLDAIKEKTDYLKKSFSTSWYFFIEIAAIIQIIKVIFRDYRGTPKAKRSMIKSAARGVMRNPKTVTKINKLI